MNNDIFVTKASMPTYDDYIEAIKPLWDSHMLTNMGTFHQELESELSDYLKVPKLSLMVNGHMALEMTLQAYDFPRGAEIITTPFTFISTTHAIIRTGLTPVFCDVNEKDGTIDPDLIEKLITPKTVAILPVHVYGNICNYKKISDIAKKHGLKVIYDAAHAFAVEGYDIAVGNMGDASCYSFHSTKVFNTIEGGAVVCKEASLYDKLYNLKNFGIRNEEMVASVGANAKMNEFCAIMGLLNLKKIEMSIRKRQVINDIYVESLDNTKGIRFLFDANLTGRNYAYFPLIVENEYNCNRDELYTRLLRLGIHARKYFYPLTTDQMCFGEKYKMCEVPVARSLSEKVLCIPIYEDLTVEEANRISAAINQV